MIDLLLSLSAWILISMTVLPLGIHFLEESINEKEEYFATILLYEKLNELIEEGENPLTNTIFRNGKQYDFIPKSEMGEVCIQFENRNQKKEKVCEYWE